MLPRDVILAGVPRSGTTLVCSLLNKLADTVALVEPMLVEQFALDQSAAEWRQRIRHFCRAQRRSLLESGTAMTRTAGDGVDDNTFGPAKASTSLRESLISRKQVKIDKTLPPDFCLVLKHPNAFTAMLGGLVGHFPCFAIVRDPLSVLASWNTLPIALRNGHAPAAERLDAILFRRLASTDDPYERQLRLLSWYFEAYERFLPHENIIFYESIIATQGQALSAVIPGAAKLVAPLESRNANPLYDAVLKASLRERLLASEGAYWSFYERRRYG